MHPAAEQQFPNRSAGYLNFYRHREMYLQINGFTKYQAIFTLGGKKMCNVALEMIFGNLETRVFSRGLSLCTVYDLNATFHLFI